MHPSHDPTYPLFPIFAFLGFLVSLVPLPWHIQAWNAGTCAFMVWTAISCLFAFVNALVWSGNVDNPAPVWCDISTKLLLGAGIGIPAATLCISRRLYSIAAVQTVSVTRADKRRAIIIDLCIAVGIPVLVMILHIVVQPHRFDILEDVGCYPVIYTTLPAYFLVYMWPVLLGSISFVYSGLTLRCFWMRRVQFNELMSSKNSSMNTSRYLRLMLLAFVDMMCTVPLGIYSIYISTKGVQLAPWISWSDTHFDFARVQLVPALVWRSDPSFETSVELTRWLSPFSALIFFGLFGFANEAQKNYRLVFWGTAKLFGYNPPSTSGASASLPGWNKAPKSGSTASGGSLPVYTPKFPIQKKHRPDSLASSLDGSDVELDTYTEVDLEKSAGSPSLSSTAPPEYSDPRNHGDDASASELNHGPRSQSSKSIGTKNSNLTLRSSDSRGRIYISDAFEPPATTRSRTRTPSPAPFSDVTIPPHDRPFTPPSVYPAALPHSGRGRADAIWVTVHTESESIDARV